MESFVSINKGKKRRNERQDAALSSATFFIAELEEDLESFMKFKLDPYVNLHLKEGASPGFFACQKDQKRVFTITGNGKLHVN